MSEDDDPSGRSSVAGGAHDHGPMMPYEEALRRAMERRREAAERDAHSDMSPPPKGRVRKFGRR